MTLKEKDAFIITRDDNSLMELVLSEEGLFTVTSQRVSNGKMLQKTFIIESVEQLRRNYTKRELNGADTARRLYVIMG